MNKTSIFFSGCALALSACALDAQPTYTVNAPVDPSMNNTMAYLINWDTSDKIDSVIVNNSVATFKGNVSDPFIGRIIVNGNRGPIFIVEKGTVELDPQGNASGTPLNDKMQSYVNQMMQLESLYKTLNSNDSVQKATADSIIAAYQAIPETAYNENASTPVGLFWFLQGAYEMGLQEIDAALAKNPNLGKSKRVQDLRKALVAKAETSEGKHYKDFQVTYDGKVEKLSNYVKPGRYTLVDFWASWCGPCIRQTKVIKELYNKYKDKGLDVVGVAVWDEVPNTLAAIKSHNLDWPCILNAQTIPTDLYGISGIPCILLINPEGIIVSRDKQSQELIDAVDSAMATFELPQPETSATTTDAPADTAAIF